MDLVALGFSGFPADFQPAVEDFFFFFLTSFHHRKLEWLTRPIYVAVKAGGMRIVQKHQPTATPEPPQKDDDEEEYVASR